MNMTSHGITGVLDKGLALRELQCLIAVAAGMTSKEAARELGVAPDTVNKRLLSATTKLGVTRRAALVAEAFRLGLIAFSSSMMPTPQRHQDEDQDQHQGVLVA